VLAGVKRDEKLGVFSIESSMLYIFKNIIFKPSIDFLPLEKTTSESLSITPSPSLHGVFSAPLETLNYLRLNVPLLCMSIFISTNHQSLKLYASTNHASSQLPAAHRCRSLAFYPRTWLSSSGSWGLGFFGPWLFSVRNEHFSQNRWMV
jgi:hypothetical protein